VKMDQHDCPPVPNVRQNRSCHEKGGSPRRNAIIRDGTGRYCAANNPSEASLAKRRSKPVTVTHLTPPLSQAGLYKGLNELKDTLRRWRQSAPMRRTARTWRR